MSGKRISFRASGSRWTIPVTDVLEIIQSPPLMRLPLLPDSAPGIIVVRGEAVPAIDLGRMTGNGQVSGQSAILAARGPRQIALLVDFVEDLVDGEARDAKPLDLDALLDALESGEGLA